MIGIKTEKEIKLMREGGRILADIVDKLKKQVKPGIKAKDLNETARGLILDYGGVPSFENYRDPLVEAKPFPAALCVSVNEQVVHGIPSERVLKEGDVLSLDSGIFYKGFHTDMAVTVPVGKISKEAERLIIVTKRALELGINKARAGNSFCDIGKEIQNYVEREGMGVVRELAGHGIGKNLHEEPQVLNYFEEEDTEKIKEGMVFCIEPMVTLGDWHVKKTKKAFETLDGFLSAHFEHTIAVGKKGPLILTTL